MEVPSGYGKNLTTYIVCKLMKALYSLKQSPRAWSGRFTRVMLVVGYIQSQGDHSLFIKDCPSKEVTILSVYADDIIVTGSDDTEIQF